MRIGIDIMGGDFAPGSTIQGSLLARKVLPANVEIVFIGDKHTIEKYADENSLNISGFSILHTPHSVGMADHPHHAFKQKPNASIFFGQKLLKQGEIDGFCSAGNTGATLMGAVRIISAIPGIIRPAIATTIPNLNGPDSLILDVGLNPDARPDVLYQYGLIGSIYSRLVHQIEDPKVALLNIGSEEEKGNMVTKSAYQLMKNSPDFNFIGNVEANELFVNTVSNVIVCDGFIGNIVLKEAEAFYKLVSHRGVGNGYFEMFNFENFGGTPILGIQAPVIIGHGISNDVAIKSMLTHTYDVIESGLVNQLTNEL